MNDRVTMIGVRANGSSEVLGTAPVPPKMKARDIITNYFGRIDEENGDEGAMALWACEELIDWMDKVYPRQLVQQEEKAGWEPARTRVAAQHIVELDESVFIVFDGMDDGSSIVGAKRTLEEALELQKRAAFEANEGNSQIDLVAHSLTGNEGEEDGLTVLQGLARYVENVWPGKTALQVLLQLEEDNQDWRRDPNWLKKYQVRQRELHLRERAQKAERELAARPELTVWFGSMPESNGKRNWTVMLCRKGQGLLGDIARGFCISRSEYYDRERYEADCLRFLVGERAEYPDILEYPGDTKEPPATTEGRAN